jgi:hypothetical protein
VGCDILERSLAGSRFSSRREKGRKTYMRGKGQNDQCGNPLPQLLGLEGTFRSFGISGTQMEDGGKYALAEAGLNVVSPLKRGLELVQENGSWVIDAFVTYRVPAMNVPADVAGADQVVLGYIHALQDKQAATAWALLNPAAQSTLSEVDVASMARAAAQRHEGNTQARSETGR